LPGGDRAQIVERFGKDVADGAVAVVAVDGRGQFEKTPEEIEGFGWRGWRDMFDDGAALHVEIRRERAHLVPVHKGARLGDGGKPFADFRCDIATIAAACQFKAQQLARQHCRTPVPAANRPAGLRPEPRDFC
jgi:hypothetical protein